MHHQQRQAELGELLLASRQLWQPQPFREARPAWCERWPALAEQLAALSDAAACLLNDDSAAAQQLLAAHLPWVAELAALIKVPAAAPASSSEKMTIRWDWEIPGRKRAQIEAFAAAVAQTGRPVFDWCGGKGHLARLLAHRWQVPATTLEIDEALCAEGRQLAARMPLQHQFIAADALAASTVLPEAAHLVALHACGDLHRTLLQRAAEAGAAALDLAPCCYHRGVEDCYQPLSAGDALKLSRDDVRLAVTETVTASAQQARRSARKMAWKLAFIALRHARSGAAYSTFKPVPGAWMNGSFADFFERLCQREGLAVPPTPDLPALEAAGWQRQGEVTRYSIVRHAFRRALELWLVLDQVCFLEMAGYTVGLQSFCERTLTPRNLLISARR